MTTVPTIENILWFLFGGLIGGLAWVLAGCLWCITIIGIPVGLFTGIFALARTVGWIAQLNEMLADPEYKIGRPRQLYAGSVRRDVPQNFKA